MLDTLTTEEFQIAAILEHPDWYEPFFDPKKGTVDKSNFLATLLVKVGARVKIVHNISVVDYIVNGTLGTVVGIETNEKNDVTLIIVALDDPRAGERQRNKYPAISKKYADQRGTPFGREDYAYQVKSKKGKPHDLKARILMFPFTLAWAATGHTMQVKITLIVLKRM